MREIILIQAPINLGLKASLPGAEPGVKYFPAVLRQEGFEQLAGIMEQVLVPSPAYSMELDEESGVRNANAVAAYSVHLAAVIGEVIEKSKVPLVIGGDCSVMIGAGLALKPRGRFGLFHLDGHTDYMGPELSETKAVAGMGLAIVSGQGHGKLSNINGVGPYFREGDIYCVGNREYDEEYVAVSRNSNMRYIDLDQMRAIGMETLSQDFLRMVQEKGLDGFWIHFDVDVLNDDIMPCVDSRQAGGLWYDELKILLKPLLASDRCTGMEITIFDPTLDDDGRFIKAFAHELADITRSVHGHPVR